MNQSGHHIAWFLSVRISQTWTYVHWKDWRWSSNIWLSGAKSRLTGNDPDAGKDWGQEEKGAVEDEMVGWHLRLSGHGFGWTPGIGDGQGGLACCGSWVTKSRTRLSDWTELNNMLCLCEYLAFPSLSVYFHPNCITCAPWGHKNCTLFFSHSSQPLLQHIESAE